MPKSVQIQLTVSLFRSEAYCFSTQTMKDARWCCLLMVLNSKFCRIWHCLEHLLCEVGRYTDSSNISSALCSQKHGTLIPFSAFRQVRHI